MTKSKSGHHVNSNRSIEDLSEATVSHRSGSLSSLRSSNSNSGISSSLCLDLKYPIDSDCNNHRLYSRRMNAPKFTANGFKNKLFFEKQHSHPPLSARCDERKSFSNDFHKFKSNPSTSSATYASSAKSIADSSSFRVFKMTDGK